MRQLIADNAQRTALSMMTAIMKRITNMALAVSVRSWTGAQQKEKLLNSMQQEHAESLLNEIAEAKKAGGEGLMKLIYKKMQYVIVARNLGNWKKNKSMNILEDRWMVVGQHSWRMRNGRKRSEGKRSRPSSWHSIFFHSHNKTRRTRQ